MPDIGVSKLSFLFGKGQRADLPPRGQLIKRFQRRAPHLGSGCAAGGTGASAGRSRFVCQIKERAPEIRGMAAAEHAKRDGHTGLSGQCLKATQDPLGIKPDVFVGNFKHAGA